MSSNKDFDPENNKLDRWRAFYDPKLRPKNWQAICERLLKKKHEAEKANVSQ